MGSQTIYHKSKKFTPVVNFPATENNLSWSWDQEGDGELFEIETTNVASYTIQGVINPSLPIPLLDGVPYSIAITKTTNGQSASISLRTRRAIDKSVNISVPDFGTYDGRYLYVLKSNGVVEKHDTSLFTVANYAGAGVWTSTTLVATLTLPILPNTAKYSTITFVKNGGIEKMLIQGCEINVYKSYASFIRLSDFTVWNLDFSTQNSYTQIVNSTSIYNSLYMKCAFYDYINELVVFHTTSGSQGAACYSLNLNTLTVVLYPYSQTFQELVSNYSNIFPNYHRPISIIPSENRLINAVTKFDYTPSTYCSIKSNANNKNICYNRNANVIYAHGDTTLGRVREFNTNGILQTYYTIANGTLSGQQPIVGFSSIKNEYILIAQAVTNNNYAIFKKNILSGTGYITQSPAAGSNYGFCLMKSYYNGNWYITGNASLGLRRITVINSDNAIPDFGYLDVDSDIYDMATTQIFD